MPELPEVETLRRYLQPALHQRVLADITLRRDNLRYAIPVAAVQALEGATVVGVRRRAKYLLIDLHAAAGATILLVHLGMSGRVLVDAPGVDWQRHEHWRMTLRHADGDRSLRYIDARRFGALDVLPAAVESDHRLLRQIGIEPLDPAFDGAWVLRRTRGARQRLKIWLMDGRKVAGVGNIYASEALYRARLRPTRRADSIGPAAAGRLANAVREVLTDAIADGGTSLRDFVSGDASPGYFRQRLDVYGRADQTCRRCRDAGKIVTNTGAPPQIKQSVIQGRATFFCARCQR